MANAAPKSPTKRNRAERLEARVTAEQNTSTEMQASRVILVRSNLESSYLHCSRVTHVVGVAHLRLYSQSSWSDHAVTEGSELAARVNTTAQLHYGIVHRTVG